MQITFLYARGGKPLIPMSSLAPPEVKTGTSVCIQAWQYLQSLHNPVVHLRKITEKHDWIT
jgi:hypothetical protein